MDVFYEKDNVKLILGDCLNVMQELPENSFDMIFADPPYKLSNGGITCHAGKTVSVNKAKWDESQGIDKDFEFNDSWINASKRVLKPNGTIWISGTYHSIYSCGFALQKANFKILNDIVWFKPKAPPNMTCRYFTASHETLLWAIKDPKAKHTFNYENMKNGEWSNDKLKMPNKQMRSVWSIDSIQSYEKKFGKHPTQKPLELLKRIIIASTNKNDLILDPFTGSSTTGIMAIRLGRKFVGIDTEKEYLEMSVKRFEDIKI